VSALPLRRRFFLFLVKLGPAHISDFGAKGKPESASQATLEGLEGRALTWPLQDNILLRGFYARINRPFIPPAHLHCPHCCNTIARLVGNIRPLLDLPFVSDTPYNIGNYNIV